MEISAEWKSITGSDMPLPEMPDFSLPGNYFDELPDKILRAVKMNDPREELKIISPFLSGISSQNVFSVPENYFNNFSENIITVVAAENSEINFTSSKAPVQSVPENYFEEFPNSLLEKIKQSSDQHKIIPLHKKPLYRRTYLAAAMLAGIIALSVSLFIHHQHHDINYQLAHLSENDIVEYLQNQSDVFNQEIIYSNVSDSLQMPVMNNLSSSDIQQYLNTQPGLN